MVSFIATSHGLLNVRHIILIESPREGRCQVTYQDCGGVTYTDAAVEAVDQMLGTVLRYG